MAIVIIHDFEPYVPPKPPAVLPQPENTDIGKYLGVDSNVDLIYSAVENELPTVTSEDNGKALIVSNGDWGANTIPSQFPDIPTTESPHMIGSTIVASGSSWIAKPTSLMIALDISKSDDVYSYSTMNRSSKNSDIIDIIGAMVTKPFSFMFDITLYFQGTVTPLGDNLTANNKPTKIKCSNVIATSNTTYDLYFPFALNNSGTVRTGYFIVGINSSNETQTVTFIETTPAPAAS